VLHIDSFFTFGILISSIVQTCCNDLKVNSGEGISPFLKSKFQKKVYPFSYPHMSILKNIQHSTILGIATRISW